MLRWGCLAVCMAAVAALAANAQDSAEFRQPVPPRWTQNGFISEVVTVALVAGFAIGVVLVVAGLVGLAQTGMGLRHLALLTGAVVVLALAWRWLRSGRNPGRETGRLPTGIA